MFQTDSLSSNFQGGGREHKKRVERFPSGRSRRKRKGKIDLLRGDWHLEEYDLRNSEIYGWKANYPTSYESYVSSLSSGIW